MKKYKIAIISILALSIPASLYTVSAANNSIPGQSLYALDKQIYEITKAYMTSTQGDKGKAIALKAELIESLREIESFQASNNRNINDYKIAYEGFTKKYKELDDLNEKYKSDSNFIELDLTKSLIRFASDYYAISYPFLGEIKNDPALYNLVFESLNTVTDYAFEIHSQIETPQEINDSMDPKTKAKILLDQAYTDYNDLVELNSYGIVLSPDLEKDILDSIEKITSLYNEGNDQFEKGKFDEVVTITKKIKGEKEFIFKTLELDNNIDGFNNILSYDFKKVEETLDNAESILDSAQNPSRAKQIDLKNAKKYYERAQLKTKLVNLLEDQDQLEDIESLKNSILDDINQALTLSSNIIANPETPVLVNYQYNEIKEEIRYEQEETPNLPTPTNTPIIIEETPTIEPTITPEPTPKPTPKPTLVPTRFDYDDDDEDDDEDDFEYENEYEKKEDHYEEKEDYNKEFDD